jgi:acetyl-CoA C-acetyltransferase
VPFGSPYSAAYPFARRDGPYTKASNQDMLTVTLDSLIGRFGLDGEVLGEVAAGAILKHSRDLNLTRESVLGSKLAGVWGQSLVGV